MPGLFYDGKSSDSKSILQKTIRLGGRDIPYELEIKRVKNINLRIRHNGTVHVSAAKRHTMKQIEALFAANEKMILRSLEKTEALKQQASEIRQMSRPAEGEQCRRIVSAFCDRYYPAFASFCGGIMPEIRYRRMKSRWGSCAPKEHRLTFNTRLAYVPEKCTEYVVVHEFCHFLYPNHSPRFYAAVASVLPDWRNRREELRQYEGLMV
jgi:predicted metal-dependent hydrolase